MQQGATYIHGGLIDCLGQQRAARSCHAVVPVDGVVQIDVSHASPTKPLQILLQNVNDGQDREQTVTMMILGSLVFQLQNGGSLSPSHVTSNGSL